jgi:putative ABC transport system substrate-binding protein
MRRREFITIVGGAATWPIVAKAEERERIRRVSVLMNRLATDTEPQSWLAAFIQELRQLGWTEGQNLRFDICWSASDIQLARTCAAQLIGLTPDVILANSTLNLKVIQQATSTVPVVFVEVADPVKQGFVASFGYPGGNLTGFSMFEFSLGGKWVDLLKNVVPGLERVAAMFNPETSPQTKFFMPVIDAAAASLGVQVISMPVRAIADFEPALVSIANQSNSGLVLLADVFLNLHESLIADLARRYRVPAIGFKATFVKAGGLMAYGNLGSVGSQFRQAATYVDSILRGSKPSDLPVQAADRYTLAINVKTANALGLTVPPTLLTGAEEVIE